ncbi:hypothetical protein ACE460_004558 [Escherichia coli]
MSEFITPEHKIIALILEASGEPTDADKVFCLGNIPDVALAVRQLREMVIQHSASEAIPAENTQTVSELNRPGFFGECLVRKLRLPDHYLYW